VRCGEFIRFSLILCSLVLFNPASQANNEPTRTQINTNSIAQQDNSDWLSYGRDYHDQRYSSLSQVNSDNVSQLGMAWAFETDHNRGLEATPLIKDGVMYVTGNWSVVYALDARNGQLLWKYDPQVPKEWGKMACCGVVNRGVALYEGKVFVGTLDARLIALDASSGKLLWSVQTADIQKYPYSITGAPRAAKGKICIGNGGAEYGVRGFVSAYDVNTGERIWRFYTVPGNPAEGFEDPAQQQAAKTWNGEWWVGGGGGTVWDSIVYDPELDQLYIGVGNGSPWNRRIRSPGGGDNLYLSSIVALNPDTGEYIWHYQETPAESWDYTATQHIMLAEVQWQGQQRKVIWHAPKNGFFFIIDRTDGELLSAEPYAKVTWASHYDMETGRPIETPNADYSEGPVTLYPSSMGAHNWQPMAHHPNTGLVYIPVMESLFRYEELEDYLHHWGHFNVGSVLNQGALGNDLLAQAVLPEVTKGGLLAWNPVTQQPAWQLDRIFPWNGGLLATGDDLIFQGLGVEHEFQALSATTGEVLWRFDTKVGIVGSPVTYSVDGEQYIAIAASWGGAFAMGSGIELGTQPPNGRILSFKLGAEGSLPPLKPMAQNQQPPPRTGLSSDVISHGQNLYVNYCGICHGQEVVSYGAIPDLRRLPRAFYDNFDQIVLDGAMKKMGMVGFKDVLTQQDSDALKAYILEEANEDWELRQQPDWWIAIKKWFYSLVAVVIGWLAQLQA
jgi:quinohemoprotein ethanol dehydrogenase